ncbi:MAG TPA: hypothetical protein VF159_09950 [Gemmatimonadaceae bacterium]
MSINKIGTPAPNVLRSTAPASSNTSPVRDGNRTLNTNGTQGTQGTQQPVRPRGAPTTRPTTRPASGPATPAAARGNQSLPVEPPPGTDPALWSVLSGDERAFFAKMGAMGPLTYGKVMNEARAQQLPATRGGRLDVKI